MHGNSCVHEKMSHRSNTKKVGNEFPCLLGHPAKKIAESFALLKDTGGKYPIAQLT